MDAKQQSSRKHWIFFSFKTFSYTESTLYNNYNQDSSVAQITVSVCFTLRNLSEKAMVLSPQ